MKLNKIRVLLFALLGGVLGYLILHPYSMLAYSFHGLTGAATLKDIAASLVRPDMLHMGIPFVALGAAAGTFFGLWLEAGRRKAEVEKKALALDTLKQLMVTLSHYLLNACTVIGGFAGLALKKETDPGQRQKLEVIEKEAENIEAVIKSLQSLQSVASEHYTKDGETMLIDIKADLERRLAALKKDKREA